MNLLRWYMEVGGMLAIGYGCLWAATRFRSQDPSRWLKLSHAVVLLSLVLPALTAWVPREALPHATVQVWSGRPRGHAPAYTLLASASQPAQRPQGWAIGDEWLRLACALAALAVAVSLGRHAWRLWQLRRSLGSATQVRRIGRVSVLISDHEPVPFSAWWPGRAFVVLPIGLLSRREDFAIALRHEIQHHRQGDTRWVHLFEVCRALFFWNPAAHGWARMTEHLQELACDEILIGRRKVSPQAYGSCLFRVAQQAMSGSPVLLAGTTGMAAGRSGRFLMRRIEMLFVADRKRSSKSLSLLFVTGTLILMASTAFASRGLVQNRSLTLDEARKLAAPISDGEIPITVNEPVLAMLNQYVGTPEGRESVKAGLARMPLYRAMIEGKIAAQGFPAELLAMPLQESRFRNDIVSPAPFHSRGIWQFIEPTAVNYGLEVDDHIDERLDPEKETDAAMAYLKDLKAQFGDWRLAIKGYNEGERHVQALIDKYHTRDPWVLDGHSAPENYLAGTMAMMIILKNPSLLD